MRNKKKYHQILYRTNKLSSFYVLKKDSSYEYLCQVCDRDSVITKSKTDIYICGNALPDSYEKLGVIKGNLPATDIITELNWNILSIRMFKDKINQFLLYKKEFDNNLILGNYSEADNILSKIEKEICCSLWSLENRLLLIELSQTPEKRWEFAFEVMSKAKGLNMKFIVQTLSEKAEKGFSVAKFNTDFKNIIKKKSDLPEEEQEYYYFKFNFFEEKYSHFNEILNLEFHYSIIDRYLTIIKSLKCMLLNQLPHKETWRKYLENRISYLNKKIIDDELKQLMVFINPKNINKFGLSDDSMSPFNSYIQEDFKTAITISENMIQKYPNQIEYYILFVKSHLLGRIEFKENTSILSIQQKILDELYLIFSKKSNPSYAITNLNRFLKQLTSFQLASGLFNILNSEYFKKKEWQSYAALSYKYDNPQFSEIYEQKSVKVLFLKALRNEHGDNTLIKFYESKEKLLSENSFLNNLNISNERKLLETAKHYQKYEEYQTAIQYYTELLEYNDIALYKEKCIEGIFFCQNEMGNINEAISLYVEAFISNRFLVQKIDCEKVFNLIQKFKFRNVTPNIHLALFYAFQFKGDVERHQTYRRFLKSYGVEKASDLLAIEVNESLGKLILFYYVVCDISTLSSSSLFENSIELINERLKILLHLLEIDSENSKIYISDINEYNEQLIILEGKKHLDESKIHVSEQELISELKEYEGLFDRYKTVSNLYKENKNFLLLYSNAIVQVVANLEKKDKRQIDQTYSENPLKDVFKEVFNIVLHNFLNSKAGISAYLSTRIRHGVFDGEIRPVFEKYALVSLKENNKYTEIGYWNNEFSKLGRDRLNQLQSIISDFSQNVDNTIEEILKNNLQISTDFECKGAWFDYYYTDITLEKLAMDLRDCQNYHEFIKKIIEILWERTNINLEEIRICIKNEIKERFNSLINDFRNQLEEYFLEPEISKIYTNINACSTEIDSTFDKISSWFNRSGKQAPNFYLKNLASIVLDKINNISPKKTILMDYQTEEDYQFKGEYFFNFVDLFRIFFENIVKHSDENAYKINAELKFVFNENKLQISIKNDCPDISKLQYIQNTQSIDIKKLVSENKSGLNKSLKIIQYDLKDLSNSIKFFSDETNRACIYLEINYRKLLNENTDC